VVNSADPAGENVISEPFHKFCSHAVRPSGSGLFGFWLRFRSVWFPKPCEPGAQWRRALQNEVFESGVALPAAVQGGFGFRKPIEKYKFHSVTRFFVLKNHFLAKFS
jgi:hypothetical protein